MKTIIALVALTLSCYGQVVNPGTGAGGGGGAPTGAAGGALGGTYPNPTVLGVTQAAATTTGPALPGGSAAGTIGLNYLFIPNNAIVEGQLVVASSGIAGGTGTGTFYLGDGLITKAPGSGYDFHGAGLSPGSIFMTGPIYANAYNTIDNCASGASPAVCGSAQAGAVAIPTGVNPTLVVNTSAVTASSRIRLQSDDSVTIGGVTCNSTLATLVGGSAITARTAGTSFTISYSGTITTNPACVTYFIVD